MKWWNCGAVVAGFIATFNSSTPPDHAFNVRDDIAMVHFSDPFPQSGVPGTDIVSKSPDGRYFVVITTKGLIKSDQIESQLLIFDQAAARGFLESKTFSRPPAPRVIATIVGSPRYEASHPASPVIDDLHWSPDMKSVYFKGENATGAFQLYIAKTDGSGCHSLTQAMYSVDRFDVEGDTIAYTASLQTAEHIEQGIPINRDASMVTGYSLVTSSLPGQLTSINPESFSLWVMKKLHGGWTTRQVTHSSFRDERYFSFLFPFKLSPRGDKLIGLTPVIDVPALWNSYRPAAGFEDMRLQSDDPRLTRANNLWKPQEYSLVDLESGNRESLVGAPNARTLAYLDSSRVVWAADERRVLVSNSFLPLDQGSSSERARRVLPCAVASVDMPSLDVRCLTFDKPGATSQPSFGRLLDVAFGVDENEARSSSMPGPGKRD